MKKIILVLITLITTTSLLCVEDYTSARGNYGFGAGPTHQKTTGVNKTQVGGEEQSY